MPCKWCFTEDEGVLTEVDREGKSHLFVFVLARAPAFALGPLTIQSRWLSRDVSELIIDFECVRCSSRRILELNEITNSIKEGS